MWRDADELIHPPLRRVGLRSQAACGLGAGGRFGGERNHAWFAAATTQRRAHLRRVIVPRVMLLLAPPFARRAARALGVKAGGVRERQWQNSRLRRLLQIILGRGQLQSVGIAVQIDLGEDLNTAGRSEQKQECADES